jgi:dipeptide/tripeptide permease
MDNRTETPEGIQISPAGPTSASPERNGMGVEGRSGAVMFLSQRTFLGHPIGLYVLFFTEMWERFSYYGMRALLMLYMLNYLRMSQKDASTVYKVYTSFVYVTPIIGGYLADRFLGNKRAVIIGAILMAIGHFLMAFEAEFIFYSALVFLIFGNGMFKPNMSTQVGRLYAANDGRRDGAYTIFYMGINLGAFFAPLVCGWLRLNTVGSYHTGFTMAGIGMVTGLVIYLVGQPFVRELAPGTIMAKPSSEKGSGAASANNREEHIKELSTGVSAKPAVEDKTAADASVLTEAQAEQTPSILGLFAKAVVLFLAGLGVLLILGAPVVWLLKLMDVWDSLMLAIGGGCLLIFSAVAAQVHGGVRDRVYTILILGIFVMFFWAVGEQAGNVLNVWADKNTNCSLWKDPQPPELFPEVAEDAPKDQAGDQAPQKEGQFERFQNMFRLKAKPDKNAGLTTWQRLKKWGEDYLNPISPESFQSINPLAIFVLAPLFAILWVWLDKRGIQPSIPLKMAFGLFFVSASVALMIVAARQEDGRTTVPLKGGQLPQGLVAKPDGTIWPSGRGAPEPYHAGRITFDNKDNTLILQGVLPDTERDLMIEATAPGEFAEKVKKLKEDSENLKDEESAKLTLDKVPDGFDWKFAGLKKSAVEYLSDEHKLIAHKKLGEKEVKGILRAAGQPEFRDTLNSLYLKADTSRVSPWWLFWSYILVTVGELCLSPVGLSMVSKLAPARYSTMLMGVWMLTSAFGNFAAGAAGEQWGKYSPVAFFTVLTIVATAAAVVLLVITRLVRRMMHGVK